MNKKSDHISNVDFKLLFETAPALYLVLSLDLEILAASDAYLKATSTQRNKIVGRELFEVFPDNPDDPNATVVANLRKSLQQVLKNGVPDTMAFQKYDIKLKNGRFEVKYWSPINTPIFEKGKIKYILHRAEDLKEILQHESKNRIKKIRNQINRMEKLLFDLLTYSKIDYKQSYKKDVIETDIFIESIITVLSPPSNFSINKNNKVIKIKAELLPLQQILHNLIHNAIKDHDKQKGLIEIVVDESKKEYVFEVKDDGPGIPKEYHEKVFELFQTLRPASTNTGMGLSLAKKYITCLGGDLTIHSPSPYGTQFRVTIPK